MKILISGSSGLIGGEAVEYFDSLGHTVVGLDNNMRREFFGPKGDTLWNMNRIFHKSKNFIHMPVDIRDEGQMYDVFYPDPRKKYTGPFDVVIHCAAQPSHDKARDIPLIDHSVNVLGTLMMLEMTRRYSPNAVFIFTSTNKVYGDAPNEAKLTEQETRYDYYGGLESWCSGLTRSGFNETCRIDRSTHSIFGANKAAADLMVQEYAKTYGLKTAVLRGGCLTGPSHSGVELHGFLSYLVKSIFNGTPYTIYGYKGKQVRDNIHSYDVVRAMEEIIKNPQPGEVYNIGGGRENSCSVLEAISKIEDRLGKKGNISYSDQARLGDHICYISDMSKFRRDYPNWKMTRSLDQILDEMVEQVYWDKHTEHEFTLEYPLTEKSVVMDIGGFRGTWAADLNGRYHPKMTVFEPSKEYSNHCKKRFANDKNVTVFNFGFSDKNELLTLTKQGINSSVFRGGPGQTEMPDADLYGHVEHEEIVLTDISEFLEGNEIENIDLLNINCEGGEFPILERLIETGQISIFDNIQIQFHDFYPNASEIRSSIRDRLRLTHTETFCYPWIWESWKRK